MAKSLNYNNVKKRYLNVTLADAKNTVLMVGMPTKAAMSRLFAVQERMDEVEGTNLSEELLDDLYAVCAAALSRNKTGVVIHQAELEELFDLDDIMLFFDAYLDFVGEAASEKN